MSDELKRPSVACAVLHTDAEGDPVPCPGYPHPRGTSSQGTERDRPRLLDLFCCAGGAARGKQLLSVVEAGRAAT